jgi:ornithine carbamoyltransferase
LERFKEQGAPIEIMDDVIAAVSNADVVITDQWPQAEYDEKLRSQYRVTSTLLQHASDNYLFLHKLPASRGEEVTEEILEGRHSVVYQQAGNRLCVQQAVMEWLLGVRLS